MARRVMVFLRVLAMLLPIMPLPRSIGTGRALLPRPVIAVSPPPPPPASAVFNTSAEDVFNTSAEGLTGP